MHPTIMRQLAAEHIREMHARADDERRAHQARRTRRRAPSARPRLLARGELSRDWRPAMTEQPSAPPLPVLVGPPPADGDAAARLETLNHRH